jgi:anaerobic magnesium-protoporphyrin IX monomethyl ester cyclase
VLLINPASEQFGGVLSNYVPVGIPVPIGTLAAWLMKHGHKVQVADDELGRINETQVRDLVKSLPAPYVFGISILAAQCARAYQLQKMLKNMFPDCLTIAGGIHVTAVPEEALREGFDFVIRGEGERPLLELYNAIRNETNEWKKIESLSYIDDDGSFCHNPDGALIANLDDIPIFPYHLFNHPKYDYGFLTSSRGCPYKCSYCSQRLMTGLTFRFKSAQRIVEEIRILVEEFKQTHVTFYDDNFCFNRRRVIELADAICAAGLHKKCTFFIQTRADNFYEEAIPHLKRAGFTSVGFGMETAVERLAIEIQKGESIETHRKAIRLAQKNGIDVSLFMIFGLPTETHADRMASYQFVKDMGIRFTKFNNLIPYPGTKLYTDVKNTTQISIQKHWQNFNSTLTATRSIFNTTPLPFVPAGTSEWQLKRDIIRCNLGWYLRPAMIWDILKGKDKGPGFVALPKGWWLNPNELMEMIKIALVLGTNFGLTLLPYRLGEAIYLLTTTTIKHFQKNRPALYQPITPVIDGTMRRVGIQKSAHASVELAKASS